MKAFQNLLKNKNNTCLSQSLKYFSAKHSQVIVIGAGSGGLAVSNQLANDYIIENKNITIFDKTDVHYYQPGWTKLGGGIIKDIKQTKYNVRDFTSRFNFQNRGIAKIDAEHNSIITEDNETWTYDQLVIAAGLDIKLDSIPGLKQLMDDQSKFVGTIYDPSYAQKVKRMRETFKGGRALFTQPPPPIKCGGAPQKIAYLCDDYWRKNGVNAEVHFFTPLPQMFAVKYYSDSLYEIVKQRGINPHFTSALTSVRDGVATFKNTSTNQIFEEKFDFLHAVPLMGAPTFLQGSSVANPSGFVTIDPTMRHKKFPNVWAIGDCTDLPNAKTAAAVFSQAPVLVRNLEAALKHQQTKPMKYDGYSSCPLYLSKGNLLLAEFKEYNDDKGNLVRELDESFNPGWQHIPRRLYYWVAYSFTTIYPYALKGKWFGKDSIVKPTNNSINIRKYYKYIDYIPHTVAALTLLYLLI